MYIKLTCENELFRVFLPDHQTFNTVGNKHMLCVQELVHFVLYHKCHVYGIE